MPMILLLECTLHGCYRVSLLHRNQSDSLCLQGHRLVHNQAPALGIDRERIGVGGDSAGATLAAGLCMMVRERSHPVRFLFQMLPYPFPDARNSSESCRKYTDTPMWNSSLSARITPMTKVDRKHPSYHWYSPVETNDFSVFPPAYIETAEFDCLHDDGILFVEQLKKAGTDSTPVIGLKLSE